jgi:hypothetical protein
MSDLESPSDSPPIKGSKRTTDENEILFTRRPSLRIVPYSPNDYSLGEVLARSDGTRSNDAGLIASALSLYFQWPEHRSSLVYKGNPTTTLGQPCEMSFDKDDREPEELQLIFREKPSSFEEFQTVYIRFEVFRVCYEIVVQVLAVAPTFASDKWFVITTVPSEIAVFKARRLPRVFLDDLMPPETSACYWENSSGDQCEANILEIGLSSITVAAKVDTKASGAGSLVIQGQRFDANIVRIDDAGRAVLSLKFTCGKELGRYFEIYRRFAFPSLLPRSQDNIDQGVQLYEGAGYLSKFGDQATIEAHKSEMAEVWRQTISGTHITTADYFATNNEGRLVGSSSCVSAFQSGDRPVWAFHQLCTLTDPSHLSATRDLYLWRSEYLASRPEDLVGIALFDSKSRWLERIYVKFVQHTQDKVFLCPVYIRGHSLLEFSQDARNEPCSSKSYTIGNCERLAAWGEKVYGAVGPRLLNASSLLNLVIDLSDDDETTKSSDVLCALSKEKSVPLVWVAKSSDQPVAGRVGTPFGPTDRFCRFEKADLLMFATSVDHALAVIAKKYEIS